jgi:hypothetical protein
MLEGVVLERVKCFKYLGVWIQEDGRWGEMVRNREEKGRSRVARLRGQWNGSKVWSVDDRRRIWETVGRAEVEYGNEIWGGEERKILVKLEQLELEVGREVLGVGGTAPKCFVTGELGWERVEERGWERMARFVGKLERMEEGRTVKKVYRKMKLAWRMERIGGVWIRRVGEVMRRWNLMKEWDEGIGELEKGMWNRRVRERKLEWGEKRWKS